MKDEADTKLRGILELLGLYFLDSELPCNHGSNRNGTNCMAGIIPHRRECFYSPNSKRKHDLRRRGTSENHIYF